MSSPLILISGSTDDRGAEFTDYSLSLSMNYPRALRAAGGRPLLLPCLPDRNFVAASVRGCDGILLTGGDDIAPELYTKLLPQNVRETVHCAHPSRDLFELLLIKEAFRQRKALLCICRGHQILNVALGGTLLADISQQKPRALNHSRTDRKDHLVHDIRCEPGSMMARIAGNERLKVNSAHHQAVADLAGPLRATAFSRDGIIEGMELAPTAQGMLPFLLAVQFHPERLFDRHAAHLALFRIFICACRRQQRNSKT